MILCVTRWNTGGVLNKEGVFITEKLEALHNKPWGKTQPLSFLLSTHTHTHTLYANLVLRAPLPQLEYDQSTGSLAHTNTLLPTSSNAGYILRLA